MAAFDASGDKLFLQKAGKLAEKLLVNFPQSKHGVHSLASVWNQGYTKKG